MTKAKNGDTVQVHYTGRLDDGEVFDTSVDGDPLEFTVGGGQIIPGFEQAVIGMGTGESKTVEIPADEAYGPHIEGLIVVLDRKELPPKLEPEVGQELQIDQPEGGTSIITIVEVTETNVTIDANHPLAGKDLTFDIEVVSIA